MAEKKKKTKTIKRIHVDADKCNGCRACELACSSFHATPKHSGNNPARSLIRKPLEDMYVPVYAGEYTAAECMGRNTYTIDGKEYDECALCRASCPSRDLFKEPDSGLPLKCDMCESVPQLDEPLCVKWCMVGALKYEEREVEVDEDEEEVKSEEVEVGLESLVDKFGLQKVMDTVARLSKKS